jgi:hypothetical protein
MRREASRFRGGQPGVYVFSPEYLDCVFLVEGRLCRAVREGLEGELDEAAKLSTANRGTISEVVLKAQRVR